MITRGMFLLISFLFSLSLFAYSYVKNDDELKKAAFCVMIMSLVQVLWWGNLNES